MKSPELLYKLQMTCWNSCEKSKHWLFCGFILAGFARTSFCSLEMIWKNWGCSFIVEPIRSMHKAIGPIPSTSRQQQKEWSGGASECRHVRLSQTSELSLLEHHALSWSRSLWLGRIQGTRSGSQPSGELIKVLLPWCWFLFRVTNSFAGPTPMFNSSLQFSAPYAGHILTLLFFCGNIALLKVPCLIKHTTDTYGALLWGLRAFHSLQNSSTVW